MGFVPWSVSFFYYCFPFYRLCTLISPLKLYDLTCLLITHFTEDFENNNNNRAGNRRSTLDERSNVSVYQRHVAWTDISPCLERTGTYSYYVLRQFSRWSHFLADFSDQLIVKRRTNGREAPLWIQRPWCLCVCVKSAKHTVKINHTLLCLRASLCVREEEGKEKKRERKQHLSMSRIIASPWRLPPPTTSSSSLLLSSCVWVICCSGAGATTNSSCVPLLHNPNPETGK